MTEKKVLALFPVGKPDTYLQVQRAIYGNSCELIESEYCSEWIDVETAQGRTKLMAIGMFAPADIANQINAMIRNPAKQSYQAADCSKLAIPAALAVGVLIVGLQRARHSSP